MRMLQVGYG